MGISKVGITKEQREVYDFVVSYIDENGEAPLLTEIGEHLETVPSNISRYLYALEDRGWITLLPHCKRSISIL